MARKVLLIAGPPCAGKSTLARELAAEGDTILDRDTLAIQMGLGSQRQRPKWADEQAEIAFRAEAARIAAATDITAYVVRSLPRPAQRQKMAEFLGAEVRLLDPGFEECVRRARQDKRPPITYQWIVRWYARAAEAIEYTPWQPPTTTPIVGSRSW